MDDNKLVNLAIIFLGFGLLFLALREFQTFLRPFFIAVILAILFAPVVNMSAERKKVMWFKTGVVIMTLFIGGALMLNFLIDDSEEIGKVSDETTLKDRIDSVMNNELLGDNSAFSGYLNPDQLSSYIASSSQTLISGIGSFFGEFLLVILFLMFILPSYNRTVNRITKRLTPQGKRRFMRALKDIEKNVRKYYEDN